MLILKIKKKIEKVTVRVKVKGFRVFRVRVLGYGFLADALMY